MDSGAELRYGGRTGGNVLFFVMLQRTQRYHGKRKGNGNGNGNGNGMSLETVVLYRISVQL